MTAPGAANEVRLEIFANKIDGWVLFDDVTLRELIEGDEEERSIYSLAGRPIAVRNVTFNPSGTPTADDLRYVLSDHLGSHSAFTDETGSLIDINGVGGATYRDIVLYEPFGAYRNNARPDDITGRSYTGHQDNEDVGLVYMKARYYLPYINRFLSPDPIIPDVANPQSHNRYSYVLNRPINFTDPSGHCAENGDDACWTLAESLWQETGIALEHFSGMTFDQLSRREYAMVLAFTLQELAKVQAGSTSDAQAMFEIINFAVNEAASGDVATGFEYLASVFYRSEYHSTSFRLAAGREHTDNIINYRYQDFSNGAEFGVSGFQLQYHHDGGTNQIEHFIGAGAITAFTRSAWLGEQANTQRERWGDDYSEADERLGNIAAQYVGELLAVDESPYQNAERIVIGNAYLFNISAEEELIWNLDPRILK